MRAESFTLQRGHRVGENHRVDYNLSTLVLILRPLYGATGGRPNMGARRAPTEASDAGPDDDKQIGHFFAKQMIPFDKRSLPDLTSLKRQWHDTLQRRIDVRP